MGIIAHELFHLSTQRGQANMCLSFGGESIAYVEGFNNSSELVAYAIVILFIILGAWFVCLDSLE